MISRDQAIVRIVAVANELRRYKLDHYDSWQREPQYIKLSKEYEALSLFLEKFN
jgi:hypothetical protein